MSDFAGVATDYAKKVVRGYIPAGKYVRLACQRHLSDLKRSDIFWDIEAANRVCRFAAQMRHTKAEWAGQPIVLEPWQLFIVCSLFGWKNKAGYRRFRNAYACIPRKNGKSVVAAIIGNYMAWADGEPGAEVYSGAGSEKQAWEVYRPARLMLFDHPQIAKALGVTVGAKHMVRNKDHSRFEPVIGKPGDGASPTCALVDEYHEHADSTLLDTMKTGMGARRQPLLFIITTAGTNTASACYEYQMRMHKILEGTVTDDKTFAVIYSIDEEDDWTTREALIKANPNFGVSVFEDFLIEQQTTAMQDVGYQSIFKTKHLDIWVNAKNAWINMLNWNACADKTLKIEDFKGCKAYASLDIASCDDLAARVIIFVVENVLIIFGQYYCPEEATKLPQNQHYERWVLDGYLTATPGDAIDYETIRQDMARDIETYHIQEVGFDPWNSEDMAQQLVKLTQAKLIEVPQTAKNLSYPMKRLATAVNGKRLRHGANPCMDWMISNVTNRPDRNDNWFPDKEAYKSKIDGAAAMISAMSLVPIFESDLGGFEPFLI